MQKSLVVVVAVLLICLTLSIPVSANGGLSAWNKESFQDYAEKINIGIEKSLEEWKVTWPQQMDNADQQINKDLEQYYLTTAQNTEQDIENYQDSYTTRLLETKSTLLEMDFTEFKRAKKKEINEEIANDVESFLETLLAED